MEKAYWILPGLPLQNPFKQLSVVTVVNDICAAYQKSNNCTAAMSEVSIVWFMTVHQPNAFCHFGGSKHCKVLSSFFDLTHSFPLA